MRQVEPLLSCSQGFVPLNRRFSRHHLRTVAGVTPHSSAASLVLMYSDIDTPNRIGVSEMLGGGFFVKYLSASAEHGRQRGGTHSYRAILFRGTESDNDQHPVPYNGVT